MRNIAICSSLNEESVDLLKTLKGDPLLEGANLHFIHCFEIQVYTSDFSPYIYPTEDKYPELEEGAKKVLETLRDSITTPEEKERSTLNVFFSQSPKQKVKEYLEESKTDLVIVATRGKHGIEGLFSSSFAEHLVKYSPCDVHILRPKK